MMISDYSDMLCKASLFRRIKDFLWVNMKWSLPIMRVDNQ